MRLLRFILIVFLVFTASCDDGDVITVELDFDNVLELCGDVNSANYVVYDTKIDPFESLTLLFPTSTANNLIFNPEVTPHEGVLNINETSVRFNYRIYDGDPNELICAEIPSSSVNITEDYEASTGGEISYSSTFIDDDNDGIPSENENQDPNGDGNFDDAQDWDGDGIPDYLDEDDDNDNVPTKLEDDNIDEDDNPFTNPRNTDGEDGPDYLDTDDDGDGTITRYEDEDGDKNPVNDFATPDSEFARYLDNTAADEFIVDEFIENNYTRTVTVVFTVASIDIEVLSSNGFTLGTYTTTFDPNPDN